MARNKHYRVSGTQAIDGHAPGDEFKAAYSPEHERYLLTGGHIERVQSGKPAGGSKRARGKSGGGNAAQSSGEQAAQASGDDAAQSTTPKE